MLICMRVSLLFPLILCMGQVRAGIFKVFLITLIGCALYVCWYLLSVVFFKLSGLCNHAFLTLGWTFFHWGTQGRWSIKAAPRHLQSPC